MFACMYGFGRSFVFVKQCELLLFLVDSCFAAVRARREEFWEAEKKDVLLEGVDFSSSLWES